MEKKEEARWLQDKATLDSGFLKIPKDENGHYHYITEQDCKIANVLVENADRWVKEQNGEVREDLSNEKLKEDLRETFFELIKIFDYYMDDTPENIVFYSLWVIGTYFHKYFTSYPYLFLNAMRGSGKSRLLKLIAELGNGRYTSSITEPIIFRTSGLLCIDELESIGGKDKSTIRELLNAAYKNGLTIMRVIKKKDLSGDNMKIEEFRVYRPIAMANIWGMEEVLGDRCITRILEKSNNELKTKRMENFENDVLIQKIKKKFNFSVYQCSLCEVYIQKKTTLWNTFLDNLHNYTNNTNNTNYTNYTKQTISKQDEDFYKKINDTGIFGRNLELFFPLFIVADLIGDDVLGTTINIAKTLNDEKRETELQESMDVLVYNFVSNFNPFDTDFISLKKLFNDFKQYSQVEGEWCNDRWFGRSLKRLVLVKEKRRMYHGIEIKLNIAKAKEKIKMFQNERP